MPVRYNCPVCRKRLSVSRRKIGEKVECPFCSSVSEVPGKDLPAPPLVQFEEVKPSHSLIEEFPPDQEAPEVQPQGDETHTPEDWRSFLDDENLLDSTPATPDRSDSRPLSDDTDASAPLRFRRRMDEFEEMDLTPMVDVTFLLLIFFMITASFTLEKTIPTPVPDPNQQSSSQPIQQQEELLDKSILIGIDADNTITIDDEPIPNPDFLRDRLADLMIKEQKAEALITVADLALQETVVYVLDTANDVGMQKIRLATQPSDRD